MGTSDCMPREKLKRPYGRKSQSTEDDPRDGVVRSSEEASVMEADAKGRPRTIDETLANLKREEPVSQSKPYDVSKQSVWDAYKRVKANQGASGVDEMTIQKLEENLEDNLYKLWNRMSSGSYFPPPVRLVEIPKKDGGKRPLGIPTVLDRIAQTVVKEILEEKLEPLFHPDSFGYRPKKSGLQALDKTRSRCWQYGWVVDLDIKSFFDNLDHDLLMKAVRCHVDLKWILLYIERWLKAPAQEENGTLRVRCKGTPQGGVISPLLANLFLHYAFDLWMSRNYPGCPFERYADDIVVHCQSQEQAQRIKEAVETRLRECRLELHPTKTKIVYCKDSNRKEKHSHRSFDFQGYTFQPRVARSYKGSYFISFSPAISRRSAKKIRQVIRSWGLQRRSDKTLHELADDINPALRGWINYYGHYRRSGLYPVFRALDIRLVRWAMCKYKRLHRNTQKAWQWYQRIKFHNSTLFAHWAMLKSKNYSAGLRRAV